MPRFPFRFFWLLVGWCALAGLCACKAAPAIAEEKPAVLPPLAQPGDAGYVSAELIYPVEGRPTPQCHASTIAETPAGLVAAWFGGEREGASDVGIWVSRREGSAWSKPVEAANGVQSEQLRHPCWNPVLFQAPGGPLLLFYKVGPSPRAWWGMLIVSKDHGRSWSAPARLGEDAKIGHLLGPVKNKPVLLPDGGLLCPSSTEHAGWRVHFELTRDLGKTWEVIGPIHDGKEFGAIQPSVLAHGGGKLQILCRSQQQRITQSWSADGGRTWGPMSATDLPNPNSGTDALTLSDGRQLVVYNHTLRAKPAPDGPPVNREMLNVALSADGRAWRPALTLERSAGEFSYPAVIQSADGLVHVTYTWKRQSIRHVVLDPRQLK